MLQAVHGWSSTYERFVKSQKFFSSYLTQEDLSRLGRNYIEMGKYLERIFPMMGIRFIAINDNYDNANTESSDSDSIVVPFKNLLNDSYCRDISIKVRSQLDIKRRKGEFIGGYAVYGYSKDGSSDSEYGQHHVCERHFQKGVEFPAA